MNEISPPTEWLEELCIFINFKPYKRFDFNRLLYKGCPSTKSIQLHHGVELVHSRCEAILCLHSIFEKKLNNGISYITLQGHFWVLTEYFQCCDKYNRKPFEMASLEYFIQDTLSEFVLGKKTESFCVRRFTDISSVFTLYFKVPIDRKKFVKHCLERVNLVKENFAEELDQKRFQKELIKGIRADLKTSDERFLTMNVNEWQHKLCVEISLRTSKRACDFNRLLYHSVPTTQRIKNTQKIEYVYSRKDEIIKFSKKFQDFLEEGKSAESCYAQFMVLCQYVKWCDDDAIEAFTQKSLEMYVDKLLQDVRLGSIKKTTYSTKTSILNIIFTGYLDFPQSCLLKLPSLKKDDSESFEAYSRAELNQLLAFLRQLFKQTSAQFINDPDLHRYASRNTATMIFHWKEKNYRICSGISKMMCAATYLLSYYTYSNTSVLFELKRPSSVSTSLSDNWYSMPAFKRRSFKTINVEIGDHGFIEIPKYSLSFFNTLLEVSRLIDSSEDVPLLQTVLGGEKKPITQGTLQGFNLHWLEKYFSLRNIQGRPLRPVISRFRETGARITATYQGDLVSDIVLGNTAQTRRKHYSKGNEFTNNAMMQDAVTIRQEQAISKKTAKEAQSALDIDVLTIDEEHMKSFPNLSRTPNGSSCKSPFSKKSEDFTRKAKSRNLLQDGEKLACADLLKCFGCSEQVIVQSVGDIWCLLSFKACIEESLYLHLNAHHYRRNFEKILQFIDIKILPQINKNIFKQAETLINDEGLHPIWDSSDSILSLIPRSHTQISSEVLG